MAGRPKKIKTENPDVRTESDPFTQDSEKPKKESLNERRESAKKIVLAGVKKKYGEGAIRGAGEYQPVRRISSGVFLLDHALGGGWPVGFVNMPFGMESSCKSTLMFKMIADAQKRNVLTNNYIIEEDDSAEIIPYKCAWIDMEGTFNAEWAQLHGVDLNALDIAQPTTQEEAGDVIQALLSAYDVIVLDSLAALIPAAEFEGSMEDAGMAVAARGNNKIFRKVQATLNDLTKQYQADNSTRSVPTVFIINQLRQSMSMYGPKTVKPGGKGQDFVATTQVSLSKGKIQFLGKQEEGAEPHFVDFSFVVEKNKVSAPKTSGSFSIGLMDDPSGLFKKGQVIEIKGIFDYLIKTGMVSGDSKSGWHLNGPTISKRPEGDRIFKTQKELIRIWFYNDDNFLILKKDLLAVLNPRQ